MKHEAKDWESQIDAVNKAVRHKLQSNIRKVTHRQLARHICRELKNGVMDVVDLPAMNYLIDDLTYGIMFEYATPLGRITNDQGRR